MNLHRLVLLIALTAIALGQDQEGVRAPIPVEVHPDSMDQGTVLYNTHLPGMENQLAVPIVFVVRGKGLSIGTTWEIRVVDEETQQPIERAVVNTEMSMSCGTGYVAHMFQHRGRAGSIVIANSEGVARFVGSLPEADNVRVYSDHSLSGGKLQAYDWVSLSLPKGRPGQVGRVTVPLRRLPMVDYSARVIDGTTGKALPGARVGAVLEQATEGAPGAKDKATPPVHWFGQLDPTGKVEFKLNKRDYQWLIAEAPGYATRWIVAYDRKKEHEVRRRTDASITVKFKAQPIAFKLIRNASLSGTVALDTSAHSGPLSLTAEWLARDLRDERGNDYFWDGPDESLLTKTIGISSNQPYRLEGLPSGIPIRLRITGKGLIHRSLTPFELQPGEDRVWDWAQDKGLQLDWSLGEQQGLSKLDTIPGSGVELLAAPDEVLGWTQVPASYRLKKSPSGKSYKFQPNALIANRVHNGTVTWTGLEPGRYKISLHGKAELSRGYRSLVFDLGKDRSMSCEKFGEVTFQLPSFATQGSPTIRIVDAESGWMLQGGRTNAHSSLSDGELRILLPAGEYFISYHTDRNISAFLTGKLTIKPGDTIPLTPPARNRNMECQLRTQPKFREGAKPRRSMLGTLFQNGSAVMPMFARPFRSQSYIAQMRIPVGLYQLHRPDGSVIPIQVGARDYYFQELPVLDQD